MEVILSPDNMNKAYKAVVRNKGKGGIDKMSCEQLLPWLLANKDELTRSLHDGTYRPNPVRRGHPFVRYADDAMIFCKSKRAAERVKSSITKFIEGKLFLKVNKEKTVVSYIRGVKYLGYSFYVHKGRCQLTVHPKSKAKMKSTLKVYRQS